MEFMAIMRRRTESFSDDEIERYLEDEAEAVRTMHIEGTLRTIWSRGDALGAVLILEAASIGDAQALIDSLPLMGRGMLDQQMLVPLRGYRGFGPRGQR